MFEKKEKREIYIEDGTLINRHKLACDYLKVFLVIPKSLKHILRDLNLKKSFRVQVRLLKGALVQR